MYYTDTGKGRRNRCSSIRFSYKRGGSADEGVFDRTARIQTYSVAKYLRQPFFSFPLSWFSDNMRDGEKDKN